MYKKILEMISYYFADEFKKQSLLLNKKTYTYKLLRVNPKDIYFISKDIITFNKNLTLLLKDNDFESPDDFKHVIKVNNNLQLKSIYLWSTDNNSTLNNLDVVIKEFISLSEELSYPSILNYFDTRSNYKWPVKINRTMFNATIY